MAKLNLKDALNTSLARTKLYIDTELAKKADSSHGTHVSYGGNGSATTVSRSDHTHSYLPLTGGTVSGAITSTVGGGQGGFIISNSTAKTMLYASSNVGEHIFGGNNDGTNQVKDFVRVGANKLKYETGGNVYDIYHAGNKPSLSALGAAASSHGTHVSYGGNGSATTVSRSDHTHSYLPLSGGTMTGNITFTDVTSTTYPAKSKTISWNGSTDGADIYYQVDASDKGRLVLNTRDDADCVIAFANKGTIISTIDNSGNFSGKAATATKATQDSAGQQINTTYIKGLSVSGKTITYTKGDGTTGTITTQDTNTTYSAATTSAAGLMSAADKTKLDGIATSANNYSHPNSGATAGSYGPSANASPAHSGTFSVPYITINAAGHVTSASTKTITLPADNNTWRGVQNNLTSDATDQSLSAAQGKALKALIDGKAASSHGKHVPDACTTITDWNSATATGWYMASGASNAPSTAWYFGEVIAHNTNYVIQTVYQFTASTDAKAIPKYIRAKMNGTWGAWTNVTVAKAVPSNAVFTDTNTWRGIQNNLTSDSTSDSLSAAQGKALKALIDGKAASSHGTHVSYGGNGSATTVSRSDHTHNYAGSSSAGGAATSANKVNTNLVIKLNSGSTEGTNLFTFNGSAAKTINITPSAIGAAASSHGTHLTIGTGSGNAAAGNHTHSYLPLTGGTVTGTLNISPDSIANATFASTYTTLRKPVTMSSDCTVSGSLIASGGTTTSLLSLTATNAYTEFQYGHGVVRVAEKNHLYLQAGSLVGETAAEVRCTLYKKASEYTNLRAYNLCAQGAVYAQGTNISSDRTLKENIKYISNANTINDEDITIMDCYNFIKDDLGLATYNYIDDSEKQQKIGFIAQDVLYDPIKQTDNKIGQLVITKLLGSEQLDPENPKLTYDVNNILGVMLGAMQVTANKTAALEQENKELKELVNNLITRIEKLEQK